MWWSCLIRICVYASWHACTLNVHVLLLNAVLAERLCMSILSTSSNAILGSSVAFCCSLDFIMIKE